VEPVGVAGCAQRCAYCGRPVFRKRCLLVRRGQSGDATFTACCRMCDLLRFRLEPGGCRLMSVCPSVIEALDVIVLVMFRLDSYLPRALH
jgi:hypothetical protein